MHAGQSNHGRASIIPQFNRPFALLAAALLIGFGASHAGAALIHEFDAAGAGNSGATSGSDGVWNDTQSTGSFTMRTNSGSALALETVGSTRTTLTKQFNPADADGLDGGFGTDGESFGQGASEIMIEAWVRPDLNNLPSGKGIVFESGGAANGFSLYLWDNNGTPEAGLQFSQKNESNDEVEVRLDLTLDLSGVNDDDFIQLTGILDERSSADDVGKIVVRSAKTGNKTSTPETSITNGIAGGVSGVAGGNQSGVFIGGADGGLSTNAGGNVTGANYEGPTALIRLYDTVDETTIDNSFSTIIPEPTSALLLALGILPLLFRRGRRR